MVVHRQDTVEVLQAMETLPGGVTGAEVHQEGMETWTQQRCSARIRKCMAAAVGLTRVRTEVEDTVVVVVVEVAVAVAVRVVVVVQIVEEATEGVEETGVGATILTAVEILVKGNCKDTQHLVSS